MSWVIKARMEALIQALAAEFGFWYVTIWGVALLVIGGSALWVCVVRPLWENVNKRRRRNE